MRLLILLTAATAALSLASSTMASEDAAAPTLAAKSSRFGKVLFDSRGFVLYAFTKDQRRSACSGACAQKWPPYVVRRSIRGGRGGEGAPIATAGRARGARPSTYARGAALFY